MLNIVEFLTLHPLWPFLVGITDTFVFSVQHVLMEVFRFGRKDINHTWVVIRIPKFGKFMLALSKRHPGNNLSVSNLFQPAHLDKPLHNSLYRVLLSQDLLRTRPFVQGQLKLALD